MIAAIERARALLPEHVRSMQPGFINYMPAQTVYRVGFQKPGCGESAFILGFERILVDADSGQITGLATAL